MLRVETASRGQRKPSHSPSGGARGKREGESSSRPDRSAGRKAGDHDGKDVEERPGQKYDSPYSQNKLNKHDDGGDNSKRPRTRQLTVARDGRDPKDRSRDGQGDRSGKSSDPKDPYKYNVEREDEPRGKRDPQEKWNWCETAKRDW